MRLFISWTVIFLVVDLASPLAAEDPKSASAAERNLQLREQFMAPAENGVSKAQLMVGMSYARQNGSPVAFARAEMWFERAAAQTPSLVGDITRYYWREAKHAELAIKWYRRLTTLHSPRGFTELGKIYRDNNMAAPNFVLAYENFSRAAMLGDPQAWYHLGFMHLFGEGRPVNHLRAKQLFLISADDPGSAFYLGRIFEQGPSGQVDLAQAIQSYRKAAFHGHPIAAHRLAKIYGKSRTQPRQRQALTWYLIAAALGEASAKGPARILFNAMPHHLTVDAGARADRHLQTIHRR